MKIYEAALQMLKQSGQPMHARDIHWRIVAKDLYFFMLQIAGLIM
jgi:hypothetical protein